MTIQLATAMTVPVLLGIMLAESRDASAGGETFVAAPTPSATEIRIEGEPRHAGPLYAHIGGKDIRIADQAIAAWIMDKGQKIAYSAADGAGGYENEGQSLRIYDVRRGTRRKVLSSYYMIEKISELKTRGGKHALLVEMRDGGLGASHLAVVDPQKGQVFLGKQVKLLERQGDVIIIGLYHEGDWERMTDDNAIQPYKTERYDINVLLRRPAVVEQPILP